MQHTNPSKQKSAAKDKFLRRTIIMNTYDNPSSVRELAVYTRIKRPYFRKISFTNSGKMQYSFVKQKQLNYLTNLDLKSHYGLQEHKLVKHLKNLKKLNISSGNISSIRSPIRSIRMLPKGVEVVAISESNIETNQAKIEHLYKSLSACKKLRILRKDLSFRTSVTEIEYKAINRYFARLTNLKELYCNESENENSEQGLQKIMSQGKMCPYVTGLSMALSLETGDLDDDSGNEQEIRVAPLLRLDIFPNLTQLTISDSTTEESLSASITQGFKSLHQLKYFKLELSRKIEGSRFLFEGLIHLPLLDSFYLSIESIEKDEDVLLVEFLQKQTQLVSLSLVLFDYGSPRQEYEEINQNLEIICQNLDNQPKLKYLCLSATTWSVQSLSRGLSRVKMTNQLQELEVGAFDDKSVSFASPHNKVKGLCDFIERQSISLRILFVVVDPVKDNEVVDSLIRSIGEAHQLELLDLAIYGSHNKNTDLKHNKSIQNIPIESQKASFYKTFAYLDQALQKLKNLSRLSINLSPLMFPSDAQGINSSVIFNVLPALKNLRSLTLYLPFLKQSLDAHPAQAFLLSEIESLISCFIRTVNSGGSAKEIEEVEQILKHNKMKRHIRQNIAF